MTKEEIIKVIRDRRDWWVTLHEQAKKDNIMMANNYKAMIGEYNALLAAIS